MAALAPRVTTRGLMGLCWRRRPARGSMPAAGTARPRSSPARELPHRRHPGISSLKTLHLPEELRQAALLLLQENPINCLEDNVRNLNNFLWSRKRAVEDSEVRAQARKLVEKFREEADSKEQAPAEPGTHRSGEDEEGSLRVRVLSELRKTLPHWKPVSYNPHLSHIYLAARMDGGYAAVTRVLHEIKKRVPQFEPQTLLDFGSGTGTVTWASRNLWGCSLREFLCVDISQAMHQLADALLRGGSKGDSKRSARVHFRHFLPISPKVKFDMVVSAYSLSELPDQRERIWAVETLWRKTQGFLVLIENGTKEGHRILMEARHSVLLADEEPPAYVLAPCCHDLACPKMAGKVPLPCNFTQAYHPLPFCWNPGVKRELFSYLVLGRGECPEERANPRVIQPVLRRSRHVHTHLCCPDGTLRHVVLTAKRSGRDLYRWACNSSWGDQLPASPEDIERHFPTDSTEMDPTNPPID